MTDKPVGGMGGTVTCKQCGRKTTFEIPIYSTPQPPVTIRCECGRTFHIAPRAKMKGQKADA